MRRATLLAFSADGQWIGFERFDPGQSLDNIALIRPEGTGLMNLTTTALPSVDFGPDWESRPTWRSE